MLHPFASDRVPFIDVGIPAVLTIKGADGANSNIHSAAQLSQKLATERKVYLGTEQVRRIIKKKLALEETKTQSSSASKS